MMRASAALMLVGPMLAAAGWGPQQRVLPLGPVKPQPLVAPVDTGSGLIAGQVIDATTNRGVAHAIVRLTGAHVAQTRLADDTGRYFVANLPAGDYTIRAVRPGYFDGAYGRVRADGPGLPLTLADAERLKDVDIRLWRGAVIDGFVLDEASEPVVGVRVQAWRRELIGGHPQIVPSASDLTDDEGAYRIPGLLPGDYIVSVPAIDAGVSASIGPRADSAVGPDGSPLAAPPEGIPPTPPPPHNGQRFVYPTLYYPGSPLQVLALSVELASGQDYGGVVFQLEPQAAVRVSGVAVGPDGPAAGQTLRLLLDGASDNGLGSETAIAVTAPDGSFTFPSVPAGQYTLEGRDGITSLLADRAASMATLTDERLPPMPPGAAGLTSMDVTGTATGTGADALVLTVRGGSSDAGQHLWGQTGVIVERHDVDDVVLTMQLAGTISGHVEFDGKTPPPPERAARIPILIVPAGSLSTGVPSGITDQRGEFRIGGIVPGRYFVRVGSVPDGWYLKSVMFDGRDVCDVPIDASVPVNMDGVVVTFTDSPTHVIGTVRNARGQTVQDATVVVFPAGQSSLADYGLNPRRIRAVRPTSDGVFRIDALPPGDYGIVAVDITWTGDWRDPQALATLRPVATRMRLVAAERWTQDLRVVPGPRR
jgi:Carboxypeptidase regulatory-like domain